MEKRKNFLFFVFGVLSAILGSYLAKKSSDLIKLPDIDELINDPSMQHW